MLKVTPTFNFHGQCEEAINLYSRAFDAKVSFLMRYSDADERDWKIPLSVEQSNFIYHAEMFIGNQRIFLSDIIEFNLIKSTSLSLTITFENSEEVKKAYEVLKDGCTVIYPMHSTTYSSCIVVFIDKFGFRWGLMTEQTDK